MRKTLHKRPNPDRLKMSKTLIAAQQTKTSIFKIIILTTPAWKIASGLQSTAFYWTILQGEISDFSVSTRFLLLGNSRTVLIKLTDLEIEIHFFPSKLLTSLLESSQGTSFQKIDSSKLSSFSSNPNLDRPKVQGTLIMIFNFQTHTSPKQRA